MSDDQNSPENPFDGDSSGGSFPQAPIEETLPQGAPNVAAKAGKTFVVLGIFAVVLVALLYSIFFGGEDVPKQEGPNVIKVTPKAPEPPPLPVEEPTPVVPPPLPIQPPSIPAPVDVPKLESVNINPLTPKQDSAAQQQALARLRSTIMLQDGGGGGGLGSAIAGTPATSPSADANSQFAAGLSNGPVERVKATHIGDLRRTIAQGRIIQATMESALNTDLPAPIRAIVSRDTYGEDGRVPLIPKGSRLIGSYNTVLGSGQTRVFVVWTRVIRPDGVDVMLDSPLVDGIGSAGVSGQIDTKFQEIFARSLLSSVMNIAVAIGSEKIQSGTTTTTTGTTGTQTTGDAATTATTNALNRLGSVTDGFIQRFLSVAPTILVDQGTPVNVFVNKDLVFPSNIAGVGIIE